MSWLDENKDRGRHPPYDAKIDPSDLLRSQCGERAYREMMKTVEKAWEANQKIMERGWLAGNDITPSMLIRSEVEHFTKPDGTPAIRYKPTFGIDLAAPALYPTKAFIPGIENSLPGEDPEIRIKVRKRKLKFNFNN